MVRLCGLPGLDRHERTCYVCQAFSLAMNTAQTVGGMEKAWSREQASVDGIPFQRLILMSCASKRLRRITDQS
jgi:hypothetical protein